MHVCDSVSHVIVIMNWLHLVKGLWSLPKIDQEGFCNFLCFVMIIVNFLFVEPSASDDF